MMQCSVDYRPRSNPSELLRLSCGSTAERAREFLAPIVSGVAPDDAHWDPTLGPWLPSGPSSR